MRDVSHAGVLMVLVIWLVNLALTHSGSSFGGSGADPSPPAVAVGPLPLCSTDLYLRVHTL